MSSVHSPPCNIFDRLPAELLTLIYINTANASFPHTSKHIYRMLNNDHAHLSFCTNIWDPTYDWGLEHPDVSTAQSYVVAQNWFTPEFAAQVETRCQKRVCEGYQRTVPRTVPGAKLPAYCLQPPWTDQKEGLLVILTRWSVRPCWTGEKKRYAGLTEAVEQNRLAVVRAYTGSAVNSLIEETDIHHAIDVNATEPMMQALLCSKFGYGDLDMQAVSTVYNAIEAKITVAINVVTFNKLKKERMSIGWNSPMSNDRAGFLTNWAGVESSFPDEVDLCDAIGTMKADQQDAAYIKALGDKEAVTESSVLRCEDHPEKDYGTKVCNLDLCSYCSWIAPWQRLWEMLVDMQNDYSDDYDEFEEEADDFESDDFEEASTDEDASMDEEKNEGNVVGNS